MSSSSSSLAAGTARSSGSNNTTNKRRRYNNYDDDHDRDKEDDHGKKNGPLLYPDRITMDDRSDGGSRAAPFGIAAGPHDPRNLASLGTPAEDLAERRSDGRARRHRPAEYSAESLGTTAG